MDGEKQDLAYLHDLAKPMLVPGPTERRDAAEHRKRILAAARSLFTTQGVEAVSMHQIAQAAGVGQGTLYRRYAHKGPLCLALLEENMRHFQREVLTRLEHATPAQAVLEQLEQVLALLLAFNEENGPLLGAITHAASGERGTDAYSSPLYRWLRRLVLALLERAETGGEIESVDREYFADVVLAPLAIDLYRYQRHTLGFSQERIATGLRRFLRHGLVGRCKSALDVTSTSQ